MKQDKNQDIPASGPKPKDRVKQSVDQKKQSAEINGVKGPEPTRYGDWEKKGRCIDF